MAIDGSKCPEDVNSTDCLLRSLHLLLNDQRKDEDAEFKWDPITFAFTLLIGLVAMAFALATILQAVLVSGKGRRKSGQRAIGDWSKYTKKEWSWSDMSFQVTAQTPIVRTGPLLEQIERQRRVEDAKGQSEEDHQSENPSRHSAETSGDDKSLRWMGLRRLWTSVLRLGRATLVSPPTESASGSLALQKAHTPAAAWISFFEDVGLQQVNLLALQDGLRSVAADYLPDDLVAVPAYAEVGVILAATTTVGAQFSNLDTTSRFPTIFGRGFQFDFRQHPILGVVGAYSRHEKRDYSFKSPTLEELEVTLRFGRGVVDITKGMLHSLSGRIDRKVDLLNYDDRDQFLLRTTYSTSQFVHRLPTHLNLKPFSLGYARDHDMVPIDFVPLRSLFFASTPPHVPAMFPKSILRPQLSLTTLPLSGDYWAKVRLDIPIQPRLWGRSETVKDAPGWRQFVWFDFEMPKTRLLSVDGPGFPSLRDTSDLAFFRACANMIHWKSMSMLNNPYRQALEKAEAAEAEEKAAIAAAARATEGFKGEAKRIAEAATKAKKEAAKAREEAREEAIENLEKESTRGYLPVLRLCLKLLHSPDDFEQWFFRASSGTRRALRWTTLQQMQQVDMRLNEKEDDGILKARVIELTLMTEALTRADIMVKDGRLPASGVNAKVKQASKSGMDAGRHHDVADERYRHGDAATLRHSDLLQTLRALVDDFNSDKITSEVVDSIFTPERISCLAVSYNPSTLPVDELFVLNCFSEKLRRHEGWLKQLTGHQRDSQLGLFMLHRLLENLGAVVVSNSEKEENWQLWDRYHDWRDEVTREVDDLIIYRCLMMYILLITAQDSSEIVESGLWEHVVPII